MYIQYCKLLWPSFNALNRMLSVIFKLKIDWYVNKGQTSSIVNEIKFSDVSIRSPAGQYQ